MKTTPMSRGDSTELSGNLRLADIDSPKASVRHRTLAEIRRSCGAFEWVTFVYLAWMIGAMTVFHRNIPHAAWFVVGHCWIAFGILCLAWAASQSSSRVLQFVRSWYPLPLYIFLFEELNALVHLILPGWFDRWIIQYDHNLAGVYPWVWLARFSGPAMDEFMQFSYMTYFLYLLILPAILYAYQDRLAYWNVMVSTAIAHYSVYVIAILVPIQSPYHVFYSTQPEPPPPGVFTAAIDLLERYARVRGAAFPSAHVAGSMVALLAACRYRRWLFWVCLPFFISMCVSTVYGRYHYVADVLAGIVVGAIGFAAGSWLMKRNGALPAVAERTAAALSSDPAAACATPSRLHRPARWPAGEPRSSAAR